MRGLHKSLAAEIKRGHYEQNDAGGLYLRKSKVHVGGVFDVQLRDANGQLLNQFMSKNGVVQEGRQFILDSLFAGATPVPSWYIGIFEGDYSLLDEDTAATIAGDATECLAYDGATRPLFDLALPIVGDTASNSSNRAVFTFNDDKTLYGAFLVSSDVKGGTTGILLATSRFAVQQNVTTAQELTVAYLFSVADA